MPRHYSQGANPIDLVLVFSPLRLFLDLLIGLVGKYLRQIAGENAGMKILLHGGDTFAAPTIYLQSALPTAIFGFNTPATMVKFTKQLSRPFLGREQVGEKDLHFAGVQNDPHSPHTNRINGKAQIPAHVSLLGARGDFKNHVLLVRRDKLLELDRLRFGGNAHAEIGSQAQQLGDEPESGIAAIQKREVI